MRRIFLLPWLLFLKFSSFGQEQFTKGPEFRHGMALRGKAFAFPGWEDRFYTNYSIGTELRFLKRHAFGIDYVYFGIQTQYDDFDSTGMELSTGPTEYDKRNYLHFDYRFYFALKDTKSIVTPYLVLFTKLGVCRVYEDDNTAVSSYTYRESFQQFGGGIGLQVGFGFTGRWGLDACVGLADFSGLSTRRYIMNGVEEVTYGKVSRTAGYIRANLYFYLFRI